MKARRATGQVCRLLSACSRTDRPVSSCFAFRVYGRASVIAENPARCALTVDRSATAESGRLRQPQLGSVRRCRRLDERVARGRLSGQLPTHGFGTCARRRFQSRRCCRPRHRGQRRIRRPWYRSLREARRPLGAEQPVGSHEGQRGCGHTQLSGPFRRVRIDVLRK